MGCFRLHIESESNLRVVYSKKLEKPLKKTVHYYPFGLKHKGYDNVVSANGNGVAQKFGFNGKELNEDLGLNLFDYHARLYDPTIGRMVQIDPHAENWMPMSTYTYTINNPVNFVDPDGKDARISFNVDEDGNISITIQTTVHTYGKSSSEDFADELNAIVSKFGSKSFKQKDGTKVTVGFDITYKHHDSKDSAVEAVNGSPGDNIINVDKSLSNKDMQSVSGFGMFRSEIASTTGGNAIGGGKSGNARGLLNPLYGDEFPNEEERYKLRHSTIHETFHFFGLGERYNGFSSKKGFETDVLGQGEMIYSPLNGGSRKNPAITVHQSHYEILGQFLIANNPNKSKNGGTRIYQSSSKTGLSELSKVE